ncbi:hypothetical protein [Demequina flava]|uniref:hypothetical protein n=1 Tax=Demequina flava TaxID=1095025 RepID=UPI000782187C|nr:hypothetical protein [Demequina flava]
MNTAPTPSTTEPTRRRFSAKYENPVLGKRLTIGGGSAALLGLLLLFAEPFSGLFFFLGGLGALAWGIYTLRGQGVDPKKAAKEAERAEREARNANYAVTQATNRLAEAKTGARALITYRQLEAATKRYFPTQSQAKLREAVDSIPFDMARIGSPRFGSIGSTSGGFVEVFRDYVVFGQEGYDVDLTTRGQVHVDGSIQVTSHVVTDQRGRQQMVNQQHDMRSATLQFTSAQWALTAPIHPDHVSHARTLVQQLDTLVESLKPQAVTSADLKSMLDGIVNNSSGQTATQRIEELNKLRYSRLLTDDEFARVKNQILGL